MTATLLQPEHDKAIQAAVEAAANGGAWRCDFYEDLIHGHKVVRISAWFEAPHPSETPL